MARKPSATVEYLKGKTWSISVRSSDGHLFADLVGALKAAEKRGLQIVNALPPFAGIESKPRKVRAKKPELPEVGRVEDARGVLREKPEIAKLETDEVKYG